jgi:hypothetical protein
MLPCEAKAKQSKGHSFAYRVRLTTTARLMLRDRESIAVIHYSS